jgi:dynein light intermediate chain 1, cytosolic
MIANANRFSTYTSASDNSKNGEQKDMWSSMLDNVASGKRLPEKNVIVLGTRAQTPRHRLLSRTASELILRRTTGGTPETQRDFLEALSNNEQRRHQNRSKVKIPPIANSFALGYTYYDVLDADQDGESRVPATS